MEPYERIMRIARREPVDRPGIDYYATPEFHQIFKEHLGTDDDEALYERVGCDIRRVAARYVGPAERSAAGGGGGAGRDFLGIVWKPVRNEFATYNEIAFHPLPR